MTAGAVALVGAVAFVTSVSAAPTWQPPARVAPAVGAPGQASSPAVALDEAGDALVSWAFNIGPLWLAQTSSRARGATEWTGPHTLSEGLWEFPTVALDAAGDGFAVFAKGSVVQAAYRPAGNGSWQDPVTISSFPNTSNGVIAVNESGDAVIGLTRSSDHGYRVQAGVRPAVSGRWQDVVDLTDLDARFPDRIQVAIDGAGTATALWVRADRDEERAVVMASFRRVGAARWDAPIQVGGPYAAAGVGGIAVNDAGDAVAVWSASSATGESALYSSYRPAGGTWQMPTNMSFPSGAKEDLELSFDAAGDAFVSWISIIQGLQAVVEVAVRHGFSGEWDAPVQLSPSYRFASRADLAVDQAGNAVVVWTESNGAWAVHGVIRPAASGTWEREVEIASAPSGTADDATVAIDERGNAIALWSYSLPFVPGLGSPRVVDRSELRAGGPVLAKLDVPAEGEAGVPVRLRVVPAPWGSPVAGPPTWTFGDGHSADGRNVRHTYRRAGIYAVSVTATDQRGSRSTSQATIVIKTTTLSNTKLPTIAGTPRLGATLTCRPGSWTASRPIRFNFAWLRGGQMTRAIGRRYSVRRADVGYALACRVTARAATRSVSVTSRPVRVRLR